MNNLTDCSPPEAVQTGPAATQATRLCAVMTCFNRRDKTLACLEALRCSAEQAGGIRLSAVLVDDGSNDGTAEAVKARYPWVQVVVNEGPPLFWCRGMHLALAQAMPKGFDYYLLLNDDTMLAPDALAGLVACAVQMRLQGGKPVLVVGSTEDATTGLHTYGGERIASPLRRTTFLRVPPSAEPQPIDTFNGNVVLLPADVVALVGNVDPLFEHAMGDIDYGLRARQAGVAQWLAPGFHGTCSNNPVTGTFSDQRLGLRARWRHILSRKGLPWRSWLHFTRRHTGVIWPLFFLWPYVRLLTQSFAKLFSARS
jgi:GT2 family glycosyltransferase